MLLGNIQGPSTANLKTVVIMLVTEDLIIEQKIFHKRLVKRVLDNQKIQMAFWVTTVLL